jgi:hypothetical protein
VEDSRKKRGIENQRAAGQRAYRNMKHHNVQNNFPTPRAFPCEEIEGADGDTQRQHSHRCRDDEKRLLEQTVLLAIHAADQQQR